MESESGAQLRKIEAELQEAKLDRKAGIRRVYTWMTTLGFIFIAVIGTLLALEQKETFTLLDSSRVFKIEQSNVMNNLDRLVDKEVP